MSDRKRRPIPTYRDLRAWDVRGVDGTLVSTVAGLSQVLAMPAAEAAQWVRDREGERAMPAELITDAHRAEWNDRA